MGKAERANPLSPKFSGTITGEIPRLKLEAQLIADVRPSKAWMEKNKPADGEPWPECPATEAVVYYRISTAALFPSRFSPPHEWPHGQAITTTIGEEPMPLPEVMAHLIRENEHLKGPWAAMVREDVARAEAAPAEGQGEGP